MENKNEEVDNVAQKLMEAMAKTHEERQKLPHQYVVAYKRKDNDELIGYHLDTFNQTTQNILEAKRYQGERPDNQLSIIWQNLVFTLSMTQEKIDNTEGFESAFWKANLRIKERCYPGLTPDDLYIDAVYLADGMEPNKMNVVLIQPNKSEENG